MAAEVIVFSGIDGCGKTTLINDLYLRLNSKGRTPRVAWLRYCHYSTRIVFLLARISGHTRYEYRGNKRVIGYHEFYRSKMFSFLFISSLFLDTLLASIVKVYIPTKVFKRTVICDRWIPDILIDIEIDTGKRNFKETLGGKLFTRLLPSQTLLLHINREKELIKHCRLENTVDKNFEKRFKLYNEFNSCQKFCIIDNNGDINSSIEQIERFMHEKSPRH